MLQELRAKPEPSTTRQTLYPEHCNFYKAENMMVISPSPFGVINELCLLGRKEAGRDECRRISKHL